jgi:hypothetical protein
VTQPAGTGPGRKAEEPIPRRTAVESVDDVIRDLGVNLEITPEIVPVLKAPHPPAPAPGALSVYLDTEDWIACAQARTGHSAGARFRSCYEFLLDATASGRVRRALRWLVHGTQPGLPIHRVMHRTDLADVIT